MLRQQTTCQTPCTPTAEPNGKLDASRTSPQDSLHDGALSSRALNGHVDAAFYKSSQLTNLRRETIEPPSRLHVTANRPLTGLSPAEMSRPFLNGPVPSRIISTAVFHKRHLRFGRHRTTCVGSTSRSIRCLAERRQLFEATRLRLIDQTRNRRLRPRNQATRRPNRRRTLTARRATSSHLGIVRVRPPLSGKAKHYRGGKTLLRECRHRVETTQETEPQKNAEFLPRTAYVLLDKERHTAVRHQRWNRCHS
jgi:hypothetical protein